VNAPVTLRPQLTVADCKPCTHCGCMDLRLERWPVWWHVECLSCHDDSGPASSDISAILNWNRKNG
jgi:hypothetical protein